MVAFGNQLSVVIVCWITLFLYWLVSAFFVKQSATKRNWRAAIIWRVVVIVLIVIFVKADRAGATAGFTFLFYRSFFSYATVGTVLTILGLIMALWARVLLGRNWSNYVTYKKEHELITTGIYRFLRHPIYSGAILMLIGTFLYYGVLIICVILVIAAVFVASRMGREEEIMVKLFGEKYLSYMKRSRRLIPWIY